MPNKLSIIRVQSQNNNCQKIRLVVLKFKQESRMKKRIKQEEDENFDLKKHQARKRREHCP